MDFKNIEAKIKKWVLRLQALPEGYKKAILWTIVVLIALPMLFFWVQGTLKKLESIESIDIGLPQTEIIEVPQETPSTEDSQGMQNSDLEEQQNQIDSEIINQQ
ncbi:MAG TPA: hypothetical protein PLF16_01650 [Candidatus Staskawiczbacteria bacterium]|nr:hypothetical protein [Candidatus Staskawiczbacteria bacterium]